MEAETTESTLKDNISSFCLLRLIRDRSFITSQGGAVVLEGGYNFKTSAFLGGKFFSGKKHEGGQIL